MTYHQLRLFQQRSGSIKSFWPGEHPSWCGLSLSESRTNELWAQAKKEESRKKFSYKWISTQLQIESTPPPPPPPFFFFFFFLPPHSTRLVITVSEGGGGKKCSIPNHQTCDLLNQLVSSRTVVCLKVWMTGHYVSYNVYNVDITYNIVCFFLSEICAKTF